MRAIGKRVLIILIIPMLLSGCGAEALYYGMQAAGALEASGTAASIAGDVSEQKNAEAESYYQ